MPPNNVPNNISWIVDTCIFYFAGGYIDSSEKDTFAKVKVSIEKIEDARELMKIIRENDTLVMDLEGEIKKEYERCLKRVRDSYLELWFSYMISTAGKIDYVSSNLPINERDELLDLNFDEDDLPFVGSAKNSSDNIIVSNDSDYYQDETTTNYIENDLEIILCKLCHGIELCKKPRLTVSKHRRKGMLVSILNSVKS